MNKSRILKHFSNWQSGGKLLLIIGNNRIILYILNINKQVYMCVEHIILYAYVYIVKKKFYFVFYVSYLVICYTVFFFANKFSYTIYGTL